MLAFGPFVRLTMALMSRPVLLLTFSATVASRLALLTFLELEPWDALTVGVMAGTLACIGRPAITVIFTLHRFQ